MAATLVGLIHEARVYGIQRGGPGERTEWKANACRALLDAAGRLQKQWPIALRLRYAARAMHQCMRARLQRECDCSAALPLLCIPAASSARPPWPVWFTALMTPLSMSMALHVHAHTHC